MSDLQCRSVGGVIIKIAYGEKIFEEHGTELVRLNAESLDIMTYAFEHLWLPNFFNFSMFQKHLLRLPNVITPTAQYLPSWFPGIQFPAYAARGKDLFTKTRNMGFNLVKGDVVRFTSSTPGCTS
jgi:hypothetical protein